MGEFWWVPRNLKLQNSPAVSNISKAALLCTISSRENTTSILGNVNVYVSDIVTPLPYCQALHDMMEQSQTLYINVLLNNSCSSTRIRTPAVLAYQALTIISEHNLFPQCESCSSQPWTQSVLAYALSLRSIVSTLALWHSHVNLNTCCSCLTPLSLNFIISTYVLWHILNIHCSCLRSLVSIFVPWHILNIHCSCWCSLASTFVKWHMLNIHCSYWRALKSLFCLMTFFNPICFRFRHEALFNVGACRPINTVHLELRHQLFCCRDGKTHMYASQHMKNMIAQSLFLTQAESKPQLLIHNFCSREHPGFHRTVCA
jgi:hypothetical protein